MECPQVGRGGVFRQITSNRFQTCTLRIALCISCMIKINKCFGKGFGWICALNRWSVQERAQTSFCPIARQILHYLAWELYRQIAAWYLSIMTPFYLLWGVRKGGWGGGHFGPEAQNLHVTAGGCFFFTYITKKGYQSAPFINRHPSAYSSTSETEVLQSYGAKTEIWTPMNTWPTRHP